jgi:protein-S-isoprenylcysteine O-methyltransferase Ste14
VKFKELLFKNRNYPPIAFYILGIVLAQPRADLFIFGMLLIGFGELMRIWGLSYTGSDKTSEVVSDNELVTNGAYAHIRNPIFAGNIFMIIGMIIAIGGGLPHLLFLGLFFFPVMYQLISSYEESKLLEQYGDAYKEYKLAVPRFYPRISPYPGRTSIKPDLGKAISYEKKMILAVIILLALFALRWNFLMI